MEDTNHLFLNCKFTSQLWDLLFINQVGSIPRDVLAFSSRLEYSLDLKVWIVIPATIWWIIWRERTLEFFKTNWKMLLVSSFFAFLCFPFGAIWQIYMIQQIYMIHRMSGPCLIYYFSSSPRALDFFVIGSNYQQSIRCWVFVFLF